jgi:hypothetical protein
VSQLNDYGLALSAAYEIFMDLAIAHDLTELKEKGYTVKEFPLNENSLAVDKLLVLTKDKTIIVSVSIQTGEKDFDVRVHSGLETKEILRSLASGGSPASKKKYLN